LFFENQLDELEQKILSNNNKKTHPIGPDILSLSAPIIGYHGIESHLVSKLDKEFLPVLKIFPVSRLLIRPSFLQWCR